MSLYDDASLIMYPSGYKEDKLYSLKPTNGDGDFTFTRASSATRVNSEGLIEEVPVNKFKYSEQFDNAVYSLTSSSITANAINSPIGTLTADKLVENTANNLHRVGQGSIPVTSGQVYTFSFYVKAGERDELELQRINTIGTVFNSINTTTANLTNGTLSVGSNVTASNIASVGDGWYRISISLTAIATGSGGLNIGMQKDGNVAYAGDGFSGVYLWGFQMNSGSTAKTYFPTTDRLNVPRLDYSGGASCASLLLESQRSNLITYSESFDNAAWNKENATITANDTTSPDGTINADKINETATNTYHALSRSLIVSSGNDYTISVFAKADERDYLILRSNFSGSNVNTTFDLNNGLVTYNGHTSSSIESFSNGWHRCTVTSSSTVSSVNLAFLPSINNVSDNNLPTYLGVAGSGLHIYGAQLEEGSYPTSYIPSNSGSQTTRIADAASKTGISSLINSSEGTLFTEISSFTNGGVSRRISISDGTTSNRVTLEFDENANTIKGFMSSGGTLVGQIEFVGIDQTDNLKIALTYSDSAFSLFINGAKRDTDTTISGTPIGLDRLFYSSASGSLPFYGNVKQIQYYDSALTDQELQALTTI